MVEAGSQLGSARASDQDRRRRRHAAYGHTPVTAPRGLNLTKPHCIDMAPSEAQTRAELINPQLERAAGTSATDSRSGSRFRSRATTRPLGTASPTSRLYEPTGQVFAVIEAKRTARNPREGEEQLRHYVTEIAKTSRSPVWLHGEWTAHYFWDVGLAHPRLVAGFFAADDLERLQLHPRAQDPLNDTPINNSIVERAYQHEAIRRVAEDFTVGNAAHCSSWRPAPGKPEPHGPHRRFHAKFLGAKSSLPCRSGRPRRAGTIRTASKPIFRNEPRVRIRTANIDPNKRLYVATLQTMGICYDHFSPAFFDLIVFDEAHRSIFNRFNEVIEYFDARMVGLTATPAAFIDRDTFRVFDCQDQTPTFLYTYEQAIKEKRPRRFSPLPSAHRISTRGHPRRRPFRRGSQRPHRARPRPRRHRLRRHRS